MDEALEMIRFLLTKVEVLKAELRKTQAQCAQLNESLAKIQGGADAKHGLLPAVPPPSEPVVKPDGAAEAKA